MNPIVKGLLTPLLSERWEVFRPRPRFRFANRGGLSSAKKMGLLKEATRDFEGTSAILSSEILFDEGSTDAVANNPKNFNKKKFSRISSK